MNDTQTEASPQTAEERYEVFRRMLSRRKNANGKPMTLVDLSRISKLGRSHLIQVLQGKRKGPHTWKHLEDCLTWEEMNVLRGTTKEENHEPTP